MLLYSNPVGTVGSIQGTDTNNESIIIHHNALDRRTQKSLDSRVSSNSNCTKVHTNNGLKEKNTIRTSNLAALLILHPILSVIRINRIQQIYEAI